MAGDERDREVSRSAANRDDCKKSSPRIIPRTCGREKQRSRRGQRNRCRSNQRSRAPMLKQFQKLRELAALEFLVQVSRTSRSRHAESQICTHDRSRRRCSSILPPQRPMTCRKYSSEDIRTAKCGDRRTIKDRQEEKTCRSQMAQSCEQRRMAAWFTERGEHAQHACNISIPLKLPVKSNGSFARSWSRVPCRWAASPTSCRLAAGRRPKNRRRFPRGRNRPPSLGNTPHILRSIDPDQNGRAPVPLLSLVPDLPLCLCPVLHVTARNPSTLNVNFFRTLTGRFL
jgi:hypothetical protein